MPFKKLFKFGLFILFCFGCAHFKNLPIGTVAHMPQGIFRLIRQQGKPDTNNTYDIELWSKDGVDTNEVIFRRFEYPDGSTYFIEVRPRWNNK